jgi:hypothetical protein
MKLPETLSRKAIIETFNYLEPVTWEKLFEREDSNGIGKLRVQCEYQRKAYYRTQGIMAGWSAKGITRWTTTAEHLDSAAKHPRKSSPHRGA